MKYLLYMSLSLSFVACTNFEVQMPGNRFISPESQGKTLNGDISISSVSGNEIVLAQNIDSTTPTTQPEQGEDTTLQLKLELALVPRLDAYVASTALGPTTYGLKFQVIGNSIDSAGAGDHALAIIGGFVGSDVEENVEVTTSSTVSVNGVASFSGYEYGLLYGYRATDSVLLYTGYVSTESTIDFHLDRAESGTISRTLEGEGDYSSQSILVGIHLGKVVSLKIEGAYHTNEYIQMAPTRIEAEDSDEWVVGAGVGFHWGVKN